MMFLIAEIMLFIGILHFCFILLAARNPQRKGWFTSNWMFESFHLFFIMGFLIMGPSLMIKALTLVNSVTELALPAMGVVVLLPAIILIIKAMRIKERLAAYDALKESMQAAEMAPTSPPAENVDDHPPLQKAA